MSSSSIHSQGNASVEAQLKFTRKSSISFRAPHLSEFYRLVSGSGNVKESSPPAADSVGNHSPIGANNDDAKGHLRQQNSVSSAFTQRPGAPYTRRLSTSTMDTDLSLSPSILDLETIISNKDRDEFEQVLSKLYQTSHNYASALSAVSKSASEFGLALESLARLKGSETQSNELITCSGLHFLISNHQQVLSSSIDQNFEKPLNTIVTSFKRKTQKNDIRFNQELRTRIRHLKKLEHANYKISKSKKRNLMTYKDTLKKINGQIDSIDSLKYSYYDSLSKLIQDTNDKIIRNCCTIAKAEFEIYENIAKKGWSGGGMDELLADCPDPFGDEADVESLEDYDDDLNDGKEKLISALSTRSTRNEQYSQSHQPQRPIEETLFYAKISNSKKAPKKPQLVNTKQALTIQDDVFSSSNSAMLKSESFQSIAVNSNNHLRSPATHGNSRSYESHDAESFHTITKVEKIDLDHSSRHEAVGGNTSSGSDKNAILKTVGDRASISSVERGARGADETTSSAVTSKKPLQANNIDVSEKATESEVEEMDSYTGDDNSFSLPLPSTHNNRADNQTLFKNAWDD